MLPSALRLLRSQDTSSTRDLGPTSATNLMTADERFLQPVTAPRDYLPVTKTELYPPSFKLEQTFLTNSESSLSTADIRVVVFQHGEKHSSPQALYDSHRPILRPTDGSCGSTPQTARARSSSARSIENDSAMRRANGRRGSLPPASAMATPRRSFGEVTPSSRVGLDFHRGDVGSSKVSSARQSALDSHSQQSSVSSAHSIAQTIAASFSSLLSTPLRSTATPLVDGDQVTPSARVPPVRPTSPSLSTTSRCSTPRNVSSTSASSTPLNAWHCAAALPDTPACNSAGNSPATNAKLSDHKLLGEMIDSLPMRGNQASLKVHQLKSPARVMMTSNFTLYVRKQGRGSPTSDDSQYISSCSSFGPESPASPLRVSSQHFQAGANLTCYHSDQALAQGDAVMTSPTMEGRRRSSLLAFSPRHQTPNGTNSGGDLARSQPLNQSAMHPRSRGGSFGFGAATPSAQTPTSSVSSMTSSGYNSFRNARLSGSDGGWSQDDEPSPMKAIRFAVLILVKTPPEDSALNLFIHSHWTLIMRHVLRVREGIEAAVTSKMYLKNSNTFLECQKELRQKIVSLWLMPRIESPVWMTLSTFEYARQQIGSNFISLFVRAAKDHIAAGQDRFLPSVLTAVLSHHIGWVSSVQSGALRQALTDSKLAYGERDSGSLSTFKRNPSGASLPSASGAGAAAVSASSGDALQQQISEIHGAVCWPRHLARTVVVGKSADSVAVLLYLLTFFIRSTDIVDVTPDLSKECKDAASSFMRPRTPLRLDAPPRQAAAALHRGRSQPAPAGTPTNKTPISATVAGKQEALRTPLPEESNLYQTNLDRFSLGDFTPTNDFGVPPMTSVGIRPFRSTATAFAGDASSLTSQDSTPPSTDRRGHLERNGSECSTQTVTETIQSDDAFQPDKRCSRASTSSLSKYIVSGSLASGSSEAIPIANGGVPSATKSLPPPSSSAMSLLSSSLQQHDIAIAAAKETASREAHCRWLSWMSNMKPVEMSSPPGSPVGDLKSVAQGSVFAPPHSNIARSLLGGLCSEYQSDFVLHGTCRPSQELLRQVNYDLKLAVQHSILSRPVDSAVCVVINLDKWTCDVLSQSRPPPDITPQLVPGKMFLESRSAVEASRMVFELMLSLIGIWDLGMSDMMCLLHLEDGLRQILMKGKMASEYLTRQHSHQLDKRQLKALFGVDDSDMELLMAVNRVLWSPE